MTGDAVSIIVVNYNAGALIGRSIEECLRQADEVILVDNASADGSVEDVETRFGGEFRLKIIRNPANSGFAAACNQGAAAAGGGYLLFLNPDCLLAPGAVARLVHALSANPCAGMAGGLLTDGEGREQPGGRRSVPTPWRSLVRAFHLSRFGHRWPKLFSDFNSHTLPLPRGPVEVEAISGACTMVKREAANDVGPWDEGYFLHCEDLDLCMRYHQRKWAVLFVPDARIDHQRGACSRSRPVVVEWHKHSGMIRFYRKFFRHQYPGVLMWFVMVGVWLRFCVVAASIVFRRIFGKKPGPTR